MSSTEKEEAQFLLTLNLAAVMKIWLMKNECAETSAIEISKFIYFEVR